MQIKKLFHVTAPENTPIIKKNGIVANEDGEIFLFEYKIMKGLGMVFKTSDYIAGRELFIEEYALFEINLKGIKKDNLINDNVAELTSTHQWILKQKKIYPSYIKFLGNWKTDFDSLKAQ